MKPTLLIISFSFFTVLVSGQSKIFPRNNIRVSKQGDMEVMAVYLQRYNGDSVKLNRVKSGEQFFLVVEMEKGGWIENKSLLNLQASASITLTKGYSREDRTTETIFDTGNIFEKVNEITADEATRIKFKLEMKFLDREGDLTLSFSIRDKNDPGKKNYVSGRCRLLPDFTE